MAADQERELAILGQNIFEVRKLDPKNPEHLDRVKAVLEDCVYRGLAAQGRVWFSGSEPVAPIFELGLSRREQIVNQLRAENVAGSDLKYTNPSEGIDARKLTPLDPDLSAAEALLAELRERRNSVARLHRVLFDESELSIDAKVLRETAALPLSSKDSAANQEWLKNNMLYANLLINFALYQRPGLDLEPKDVAAIADIWKNQAVMQARQSVLIEKMCEVAGNFGIPEIAVRKYSEEILDDIQTLLGSGRVTPDEIFVSEIFAIPEQAIQEETSELTLTPEAAYKMVTITEEDLTTAQTRIQELMGLFGKMDQIVEETSEDEPSERFDQFFNNEYLALIGQFKAIDLIVTYSTYIKNRNSMFDSFTRLRGELEEFVPLETFLAAFDILQADEVEIIGAREEAVEFNESRRFVQPFILSEIIDRLEEEKFEGSTYEEVISRLPNEVLEQYIHSLEPTKISSEQLTTILGLDTDKWYQLAVKNGVQADLDLDKGGSVSLNFSPDSEYIKFYFDSMPIEKQQEIARRFQHIVVF